MITLQSGHGKRTELPSNYRHIADQWAQGVMTTARYPNTTVGRPVDWGLDPHDQSWLFRFHNLEYLYSICKAAEETGDSAYTDLISEIVHSWIAFGHKSDEDSMVWMRHTVALRAQALAYVAGYISPSPDYLSTLTQHGNFLADPKNYSGNWNHGFDESLALLAVGATTNERSWTNLAVERASAAISTMCDGQGATNEQASVYHFYVWKQFGQFEDELKRCGIEPPKILQRRKAITDFLTHSTLPNGHLVAVGDSLPTRAPAIADTPLEYVASAGEIGEPPSRTSQIFDHGWAFTRTGWGKDKPFSEESMLALRYGPGRAVHGHSDHTSFYYYTNSRQVVGDSGFSGYANPERRNYELNEYGHSQVVVSGSGPYLANASTELVQYTNGQAWEQYVLLDRPYGNVKRQRILTFVHDPECIVVHDLLSVGSRSVVRQIFHLGSTLSRLDAPNGSRALFHDANGQLEVRQLLSVSNIDVAYGEQSSPTIGWVGNGLGTTTKGAVVTSRGQVHARRCEFLTLISPTQGIDVSLIARTVTTDGVQTTIPSGFASGDFFGS